MAAASHQPLPEVSRASDLSYTSGSSGAATEPLAQTPVRHYDHATVQIQHPGTVVQATSNPSFAKYHPQPASHTTLGLDAGSGSNLLDVAGSSISPGLGSQASQQHGSDQASHSAGGGSESVMKNLQSRADQTES